MTLYAMFKKPGVSCIKLKYNSSIMQYNQIYYYTTNYITMTLIYDSEWTIHILFISSINELQFTHLYNPLSYQQA